MSYKNGKREHIYRSEEDEWWKCCNCQAIFTSEWLLSTTKFEVMWVCEVGCLLCPFCYSEELKCWCPGCDDPEYLEKLSEYEHKILDD